MPDVPKNAKTPSDRKSKAVEVENVKLAPEETPGWDLMIPMDTIPVWDQTPLIAMLQKAVEDGEDAGDGTTSFDINVIGDIAKALVPFAKDEAEFTKFVSGAGAMERAMALGMAWVGQMGEFASSED